MEIHSVFLSALPIFVSWVDCKAQSNRKKLMMSLHWSCLLHFLISWLTQLGDLFFGCGNSISILKVVWSLNMILGFPFEVFSMTKKMVICWSLIFFTLLSQRDVSLVVAEYVYFVSVFYSSVALDFCNAWFFSLLDLPGEGLDREVDCCQLCL